MIRGTCTEVLSMINPKPETYNPKSDLRFGD